MSIVSASLVPTLPVNGIQFLNPALASSSLSTDANGNIVAGGGSASNSCTITIRDNPAAAINQGVSRCEFVKSGNLVNLVAQIGFTMNTIPAAGLLQYIFSVDGLNNPLANFTNSQIALPSNPIFYNSAIVPTQAQTTPITLPAGSFINLSNGPVSAQNNLAIYLTADLSGLSTGTNYTLLICSSA